MSDSEVFGWFLACVGSSFVLGMCLGAFLQSRKPEPVPVVDGKMFSILWTGADPTGKTDSSEAINEAIRIVVRSKGAFEGVYFPGSPAQFRTDHPIEWNPSVMTRWSQPEDIKEPAAEPKGKE